MRSKLTVLALALCTATLVQAQNTGPTVPWIQVRGESLPEGNAGTKPLNFTIVRIQPSTAPLAFLYSTQDGSATAGSDYVATQGSITLTAAAPSVTIPVLIHGDTIVEGSEQFRLVLNDPTAGPNSAPSATGAAAILDDDASVLPNIGSFFVRSEALREGNSGVSPLRFTVTKSNLAAPGDLQLSFATQADTASAGSDFEATTGQITLTQAQPSAQITVNVIGDTLVEPIERFRLVVSSSQATISAQTVFGTILDDDGPTITPPNPNPIAVPFDALAVEPVTGETEARIAVRLMRPATAPVAITFSADPGATASAGIDYTGPAAGTLSFAPGEVLQQITFRIKADTQVEPRETVTYSFVPPSNVLMPRNKATLSIVDRATTPTPNAPLAVIIPCRPFVLENDDTARLLVKRTGATEAALSIKFKTQDGTALAGSDYTDSAGDLTWAAGNAEVKRVEIPLIDDNVVETPERFTVQLTNAAEVNLPGRTAAPVIILDSLDQVFVEDFDDLCTSDAVD